MSPASVGRIALIVFVVLAISGCTAITNPKARAELETYKRKIADLTAKAEAAHEQGQAIAAEIENMKQLAQAGQLNGAEASQRIAALTSEAGKILVMGDQIRKDIESATESAQRLHDEHGVPWWELAGGGALALLTALTGASQWKLRRAQEGIGVLVGAIERGADVETIKKKVSKAHHPTVEAAVRRADTG